MENDFPTIEIITRNVVIPGCGSTNGCAPCDECEPSDETIDD